MKEPVSAEQESAFHRGSDARLKRRMATRRVFLRLCGAVVGIGVAAPVDAHYVEPNLVDTTHHDVFLPNLPPELDGIVIVHLTDLHRGPVTSDATIRQAIQRAAEVKPDLVALTGDFVNHDPIDATPVATMLKALRPRLGFYGCLGNHDYGGNGANVAAALEKVTGVRMLRNAACEAAPGLWLAGIEDITCGKPDTALALAPVPEDAAVIFLTHNPTGVFSVSSRPVLALAGHTHGGQIRLPGIAPHLPPGMDGFPMVEGWGKFDKAWLYISRGVGMVGLPFRFRCRPEVAVLTLRLGDGSPTTKPGLAARAVRKAVRVTRRTVRSALG